MDYIKSKHLKLRIVLNLVVLVVSLVGVSKHKIGLKDTSYFESVLIDSFAPAQRSIAYVKEKVSFFVSHYLLFANSSIENEKLKSNIKELEGQIYKLQELKRENKRLKELLRFGKEVQHQKVLAQIVGWDSSRPKVIRINKGENDGIQLRSTVVTAEGLVGFVYRVSSNYSDILTILDRNIRVDAIIDRTRSFGILEGLTGSTCILKYITRTDPVQVGDIVLTSGLGNIFPKGIKIGTISRIERERYGITQFIEILPSVNLRKLEEVIVLINEKDGPQIKKWQELANLRQD